MNSAVFRQHLLISLVPWLAGVAVGGGLGYVCALMARKLFSGLPTLRKASILLPWRTIAVTLPLVLFSPLVILFGMGQLPAMAWVALCVFEFFLSFTINVLLEHSNPAPFPVRLISGARTLAVVSVVLAIPTTLMGAGGAGALLWRGMSYRDDSLVREGLAIVVLLALMADILLGALQLASYYIRGTRQQ